ncbi:MAG: hypothetical protein RBT69_08180 [Spirochaetia bacterium]|jgi:tetratricopeptide (TPR) repeat protein|nr:hypothetical protein [Spirochaetia bacterium]
MRRDNGLKIFKTLSAVLPLFLFFSCSYSKACYDNLSGIYSAQKGKYGKALADFGRASVSEEDGGKNSISRYVDYNTALVYRDIGETVSAENKLASISSGDDSALEIRINHELGLISYARGDYEDAAGFFKNAVLIDNSDVKLVQNLELSLIMLKDEGARKDRSLSEKSDGDAYPGEDSKELSIKKSTDKLLNFMFSEEVPFWQESAGEERATEKDW